MKRNIAAGIFRAVAGWRIVPACIFLLAGAALAQNAPPSATNQGEAQATVSVLMISDIHFEPFWDPGKVPQLAAAPASRWKAILAAVSSADRQQRFAALQQSCHARGADSSFALFQSSLKAMRSHAAGVRFVTMSGDLISHAFPCKYNAIFPRSTPDAYQAFVEKTLSYVVEELKDSFPGLPVYVALGNNDSGCGDYRLDTHSEFLADTGKDVTKDFPASERAGALDTFADGGYYSVSLPAPIEHTRLLVLNDIFMSANYATCAGKADPSEAAAQLAWLRQQLAEARANRENIWVMSHIPPGVDLHATVAGFDDVCGGHGPAMFLSSETMTDLLAEFGDVVKLAIFAHTHMDELRLLKPENGGQNPDSGKSVAVKMVSSISPIHGNNPSFTVAQVNPSSAVLADYRVFAASNQTGVHAAWNEEYDFAHSFHQPAFTSSTVSRLVAGFADDPGAKTRASQKYIEDFSLGYMAPVLQAFWPQYVCTLSNHTAQAFRSCVCSTAR